MSVVVIAGSPSVRSRSTCLGERVAELVRARGFRTGTVAVRDLPPGDLLHARANSLPIARALQRVEQASGVIIATPVYQAAYSGMLKTFLDLLPRNGLHGKIMLPIATCGSATHALAIDYALKPVLSSLGARYVLTGIYATDGHFLALQDGVAPFPELEARLRDGAVRLTDALSWAEHLRAEAYPATGSTAPPA